MNAQGTIQPRVSISHNIFSLRFIGKLLLLLVLLFVSQTNNIRWLLMKLDFYTELLIVFILLHTLLQEAHINDDYDTLLKNTC